MSRELAAAWVDGWVVSRGTPRPTPTPWGLRIEVGTPRQYARYVMLEAREPIVRDLAVRAHVPDLFLKTFVDPELVGGWLTPDWTQDFPGWLMAVDLDPRPVSVPEGYSVGVTARDGVTRVRVSAADGTVAAKGQLAVTGDTAVVDQVSTEPAHQRRGLGSVVMRILANEAIEAGASTGILGATVEGRALYEHLGWKVHAPLASFAFRAGQR
jgi:GNAT superfamily N-acetyltransferase